MKNRRKKITAMLLAVAMAGIVGPGVFQTTGTLAVMASSVEETQPQVVITITIPKGWQKEKADVQIQAEDIKKTGKFSVSKIEAKISEDGNWVDVTERKSISVSKNGSVYVKVTDQNGKVYTENRYVECFDNTKPTLSAAVKDGVLVIRGEDADSGVAAIYVNGNEFTELTENTLNVRLQQGDTTYPYFTLQVRDNAGNMSENYKLANPYYENPETKNDTGSTTNNANSSDTSGTEGSTGQLPSDATASKPTSATGTVTEHTSDTTSTDAAASTDTAQAGTNASSTTGESGKEFYTITTKGDKVFYLIVDKDKTSDNVYLLTEVGENDLLNFTDSNAVTLPQNSAVTESALPDTSALETEETEPTEEESENPDKEDGKKAESNAGTYVMIVLVLLGVGGAYYYLKFIKGRKDSFEAGYDDDEDEEVEPEYESEEDEKDEEESAEESEGMEESTEEENDTEDEDYF